MIAAQIRQIETDRQTGQTARQLLQVIQRSHDLRLGGQHFAGARQHLDATVEGRQGQQRRRTPSGASTSSSRSPGRSLDCRQSNSASSFWGSKPAFWASALNSPTWPRSIREVPTPRLQGLGEQADDLGVCFDTGVPIELGAQLQGSRVAVSDDGTAWATLPQ
jgi:hypothetical protein